MDVCKFDKELIALELDVDSGALRSPAIGFLDNDDNRIYSDGDDVFSVGETLDPDTRLITMCKEW